MWTALSARMTTSRPADPAASDPVAADRPSGAILNPAISPAMIVSIEPAGSAHSTFLPGVYPRIPGLPLSPVATIFTLSGNFLLVCAIYAWLALRNVQTPAPS